jgi:hypothetical protein
MKEGNQIIEYPSLRLHADFMSKKYTFGIGFMGAKLLDKILY